MCQHIWTCRHVLICADMCWYVPTCANMYHHSKHLWCKPFGPYLHAGMCQHSWTSRHVLICADICRHVASLSSSLIPTIWTLPPCWYVSARVDMPTCADMCRHVLICADMWQHVASLSAPLMPTILTLYLHAGMCQHVWTCRHVLICADMCWYVPICDNM